MLEYEIDMDRAFALDVFDISQGHHALQQEGMCAMEAVAWVAGLEHSDRPPCTSPVIASFVRELNDRIPTHRLQEIKDTLPLLINTHKSSAESRRRDFLLTSVLQKIGRLTLGGRVPHSLIKDMYRSQNYDEARSYAAQMVWYFPNISLEANFLHELINADLDYLDAPFSAKSAAKACYLAADLSEDPIVKREIWTITLQLVGEVVEVK